MSLFHPTSSGTAEFLKAFYWVAFIGITIFISVCMLLACSNVARSNFPWNFILFLILVSRLSLIILWGGKF